MIQVIDGQIIQEGLPYEGVLSSGETVFNYGHQPLDLLLREGWIPVIDEPPIYDIDTQELIDDGYDLKGDYAVKLYRLEPKPEEIEDRLAIQDAVIQELMFEILPMLGGNGGE